jgi:hypothetical protein
MQLAESDLGKLLACQGLDGGWGYQRGSSWTEPTAYALLALAAAGHTGPSWRQGLEWLGRQQRTDGGWPPHPAVQESTWVTAVPLLLPVVPPERWNRARALGWLLGQSGRESGWWRRLRQRLLGVPAEDLLSHAGWPYYPGTAAWVAPTAVTILALERVPNNLKSDAVRQRLEAGREHLLAKRCQDGGWNHGSARALGYEGKSYPETTGQALLALHGAAPARLGSSVRFAEEAYRGCRSAEGLAWLRLALLAHGRKPGPFPATVRGRTVVELALRVLAEAAAAGRNVLVG